MSLFFPCVPFHSCFCYFPWLLLAAVFTFVFSSALLLPVLGVFLFADERVRSLLCEFVCVCTISSIHSHHHHHILGPNVIEDICNGCLYPEYVTKGNKNCSGSRPQMTGNYSSYDEEKTTRQSK